MHTAWHCKTELKAISALQQGERKVKKCTKAHFPSSRQHITHKISNHKSGHAQRAEEGRDFNGVYLRNLCALPRAGLAQDHYGLKAFHHVQDVVPVLWVRHQERKDVFTWQRYEEWHFPPTLACATLIHHTQLQYANGYANEPSN